MFWLQFREKSPNKYFWERHHTDTLVGCFNGRLMLRQLTDLNFKMITSLLAAKYLCTWILKSILNPPAEAHSKLSQVSQVEVFERIMDVF